MGACRSGRHCGHRPRRAEADEPAEDEAHRATTRLVRRHLETLAADWKQFRQYHHALKHGFLAPNPEDVELVDDRSHSIDAVVVWSRHTAGRGYGQLKAPYDGVADYLNRLGRLALDVLRHLIELRIEFIDLAEIQPDGSWKPRTPTGHAWTWWFETGDLRLEARAHLAARFDMTFA